MADKITDKSTLSVGLNWTDTENKARIARFQFPNPKQSVNINIIMDYVYTAAEETAIITNKTGNFPDIRFSGISDIYKETKHTIEYDIGKFDD